jgi:hypothetical protein
MRSRRRSLVWLGVIATWASALLITACTLPAPGPSSAGTANLSAQLQFCVDEINRYRALAGRPPLARAEDLERFAGDAAQHDAAAGVPHLLFTTTNGGGGVSRAETELLRWKNYAVSDVIRQGLANMWSAGPSGEHYDILVGPYTQVGCGVFVSDYEVSVAQDYR